MLLFSKFYGLFRGTTLSGCWRVQFWLRSVICMSSMRSIELCSPHMDDPARAGPRRYAKYPLHKLRVPLTTDTHEQRELLYDFLKSYSVCAFVVSMHVFNGCLNSVSTHLWKWEYWQRKASCPINATTATTSHASELFTKTLSTTLHPKSWDLKKSSRASASLAGLSE